MTGVFMTWDLFREIRIYVTGANQYAADALLIPKKKIIGFPNKR